MRLTLSTTPGSFLSEKMRFTWALDLGAISWSQSIGRWQSPASISLTATGRPIQLSEQRPIWAHGWPCAYWDHVVRGLPVEVPIPSDGFKYWLEQEGKYAAWGFYQDFVTSVLLPGFTFMNIVAFLAEIGMAASFMLGFGVRAVALFGMIYAAQLYIGLYRNPSEWPWEYVFIIVIHWLFYIYAAGRSLGRMPCSGVKPLSGRATAS